MCENGGREREAEELQGMKRKKRRREDAAECSIHSSLQWDNWRRKRSSPSMVKAHSVLGLKLRRTAVGSHSLSGAALPLE